MTDKQTLAFQDALVKGLCTKSPKGVQKFLGICRSTGISFTELSPYCQQFVKKNAYKETLKDLGIPLDVLTIRYLPENRNETLVKILTRLQPSYSLTKQFRSWLKRYTSEEIWRYLTAFCTLVEQQQFITRLQDLILDDIKINGVMNLGYSNLMEWFIIFGATHKMDLLSVIRTEIPRLLVRFLHNEGNIKFIVLQQIDIRPYCKFSMLKECGIPAKTITILENFYHYLDGGVVPSDIESLMKL